MFKPLLPLLLVLLVLPLSGCIVTTAVGLAADVVETAVEVPIKIGGAVVSAVSSDDKDKKKQADADSKKKDADKSGN